MERACIARSDLRLLRKSKQSCCNSRRSVQVAAAKSRPNDLSNEIKKSGAALLAATFLAGTAFPIDQAYAADLGISSYEAAKQKTAERKERLAALRQKAEEQAGMTSSAPAVKDDDSSSTSAQTAAAPSNNYSKALSKDLTKNAKKSYAALSKKSLSVDKANPDAPVSEPLSFTENIFNKKDDTPAATETPKPTAPAPSISLPTPPSLPKFEAPKVDMPKFDTPKFEAPKMDLPKFSAPSFSAPKFDMPKMDALPKFDMPQMPKLDLPQQQAAPSPPPAITPPKPIPAPLPPPPPPPPAPRAIAPAPAPIPTPPPPKVVVPVPVQPVAPKTSAASGQGDALAEWKRQQLESRSSSTKALPSKQQQKSNAKGNAKANKRSGAMPLWLAEFTVLGMFAGIVVVMLKFSEEAGVVFGKVGSAGKKALEAIDGALSKKA